MDFLQNQAKPVNNKQKPSFNPLITIKEEQEDFYPTMVDLTKKKNNTKTSDDLFKFQGTSESIRDNESNSKQLSNNEKSKDSDKIDKDLKNILNGNGS